MVEQIEKRIGLNDNSFVANGKKYIVHGSINVALYRVLDELQVRAGFGASYAQLYNGYTKWVELKNAQKPFDADTHLRNVFEGVARGVNKQHDALLLICTLFCCAEGTDRSEWNEEVANEIIKEWGAEGYPAEDFFLLAALFVRRYQSALLQGSQNTSDEGQ